MLPQFELQHKRRMHAKRRRQEQRQKVAFVVFSVTCLLGLLIFFNIYYIYRNRPEPVDYDAHGQPVFVGKTSNVRRRSKNWIDQDSQPFVSKSEK